MRLFKTYGKGDGKQSVYNTNGGLVPEGLPNNRLYNISKVQNEHMCKQQCSQL